MARYNWQEVCKKSILKPCTEMLVNLLPKPCTEMLVRYAKRIWSAGFSRTVVVSRGWFKFTAMTILRKTCTHNCLRCMAFHIACINVFFYLYLSFLNHCFPQLCWRNSTNSLDHDLPHQNTKLQWKDLWLSGENFAFMTIRVNNHVERICYLYDEHQFCPTQEPGQWSPYQG